MRVTFWIAILIFLISAPSFGQNDLLSFSTDYCTSYPEGTVLQPQQWKHCCVEHDLFFWAGGSFEDRKKTDLRLKACVEASGAPVHAKLMYTAVSLGGQSPIRFKTKQWGNAWPGRTRYLSLSEAETALVLHYIDLLSSPDLSLKLKQNFKQTLNSRLDQDALFLPPFSYNSR